jgi:hypothetical protein
MNAQPITEARRYEGTTLYLALFPVPGSVTASFEGKPLAITTGESADEIHVLSDLAFGATIDIAYTPEIR